MDLSTANDILKRVRVFYAGGHKSTNKLYNASDDEAVFPHDMETHTNTQKALVEFDPNELLQKDVKRATHADIARTTRPVVSTATANKSRYEKGKSFMPRVTMPQGIAARWPMSLLILQSRSLEQTGMRFG